MIITQTPLRISLMGGGTDFENYFIHNGFGCVLSLAINKYIYVSIKQHSELFQEKFRLNYSKTELTSNAATIKNEIIRETLKFLNIDQKLYISTIADVPMMTGLGSSSSFCVGLLKALYSMKKIDVSPAQLAYEASFIETKLVKSPIGIQDHYPAVYGGVSMYIFKKMNKIEIKPINLNNQNLKTLNDGMLVFWTGMQRSASKILIHQKKKVKALSPDLDKLKELTLELYETLNEKKINLKKIGELIDYSWQIKKKFTNKISNTLIDSAYFQAKKNGAYGCKILGAGGGGFLLVIAEKKYHKKIIDKLSLSGLNHQKFRVVFTGSLSNSYFFNG